MNTSAKANKKAKEGPVKPVLITDEPGCSYIELHYPIGPVDIVKVKTENGFITAIRIEKKPSSASTSSSADEKPISQMEFIGVQGEGREASNGAARVQQ